MKGIKKPSFPVVNTVARIRRLMHETQRKVRHYHQRFVHNGNNAISKQTPFKSKPCCVKCRNTIEHKGGHFVIKPLGDQRAILNIFSVEIDIPFIFTYKNRIFWKLVQSRLIFWKVDIYLPVQLSNYIINLTVIVFAGLHGISLNQVKLHGIDIVQVKHKAIINKHAVVGVKVEQANLYFSIEREISIFFNRYGFIIRKNIDGLRIADFDLWHAINIQV